MCIGDHLLSDFIVVNMLTLYMLLYKGKQCLVFNITFLEYPLSLMHHISFEIHKEVVCSGNDSGLMGWRD